jgi:hypothetical protein
MNAHARRLVALLAVTTAALVGTTGVLAASAAGNGKTLFRYSGRVTLQPSSGDTSVSVAVETGSKPALRSLLGHSQVQSFAVGAGTEFLHWTNGVPHVVTMDDLQTGDWVNVNVRSAAGSNLDQIESTDAGIVGDRGQTPDFAKQPLFLFRGKLAESASAGQVALNVGGGNKLALRALLGHSASQTFSYDDATIFILWQGKVPTVVTPDQLKVGDRITVRIRAARAATLDQLEQTPARHVAEHEPLGTTIGTT